MHRNKGNSNQRRQRPGHIVRAAIIAKALRDKIESGESFSLDDYTHGDPKLRDAIIKELYKDA